MDILNQSSTDRAIGATIGVIAAKYAGNMLGKNFTRETKQVDAAGKETVIKAPDNRMIGGIMALVGLVLPTVLPSEKKGKTSEIVESVGDAFLTIGAAMLASEYNIAGLSGTDFMWTSGTNYVSAPPTMWSNNGNDFVSCPPNPALTLVDDKGTPIMIDEQGSAWRYQPPAPMDTKMLDATAYCM